MSMTWRNCSGVSRVAGTAVPTAGVVDEDVDLAELLDGLVDDALAVLGNRDVGLHGDAAAAERLDALAGVLEAFDAARADRDVGAGLGQPLRERDAEPRRCAGHDRHLAVQPE